MESGKKIKGVVILTKKNVLPRGTNATSDSVVEPAAADISGQEVSLQLVSAVHGNGVKGNVGEPAYLEKLDSYDISTLSPRDIAFKVAFDKNESIGVPGALIIKNSGSDEFYVKTITLVDVPGEGHVHFVCNSWVYPFTKYDYDRVFFTNKSYLPSETPEPLRQYRGQELLNLRGNGTGELQVWDRVYDYAYYNDLGNPDKSPKLARQTLGGSSNFPYPRRGRTGRPPTQTDPNCESRLDIKKSLTIYVPRDEQFNHVKMSDFLAYGLLSIAQAIKPALESYFDETPGEFDSFQDVLDLYKGGLKLPKEVVDNIKKDVPSEMLEEIFHIEAGQFIKYPLPHVIKEDTSAWRTDEEFGREMVAGVNPLVIRRLEEFPPTSKLNPQVYGNQTSKITEEHILNHLDGLVVHEALKSKRLFILDLHDAFMPYLRRINTTPTKTYATRTLLFLKDDGTLKPLAIELSLPHPKGDIYGSVSKVYTPAENGVENTIWQLAKAYVAVNDSGYHQLISHWLHTHAVIEPFVIVTNRQLSVVHPIYKLLQPHFRDTMNINSLARQALINADGPLELTVFPRKYSMEMSAVIYKDWVFPEQALPADLLKRGVAIKDPNSPHGLRLLIEDYPYAVDGLEIWSAIHSWVEEYCSYYYKTDDIIQKDSELQAWWKELVEVGHGDKKNEPWWPKMQTRGELVESCATVIWIASALHAAVNFGQYPYAGYSPNRPTVSRQFMPVQGTAEYELLRTDPEKGFLETITAELQTLIGISLIEILSRHTSDEVYLGQTDTPEWTAEVDTLQAFERFGKKLDVIGNRIMSRNTDPNLKNRVGPVKFPYTLLYPTSGKGLTSKGIPNSVSI
ncbi:probable linoleate 9S-lipoxygenase 5 [Cannabis sativa]|uniref:probable linoleate 9S-lipoxygenase 5 n=1 Tax=Cannabis sativa TaxID=3483 RepID=UPI0029CA2D45|nr:probable linoleate 9S-lipoxygenase 5 [Cannabis sativa]